MGRSRHWASPRSPPRIGFSFSFTAFSSSRSLTAHSLDFDEKSTPPPAAAHTPLFSHFALGKCAPYDNTRRPIRRGIAYAAEPILQRAATRSPMAHAAARTHSGRLLPPRWSRRARDLMLLSIPASSCAVEVLARGDARFDGRSASYALEAAAGDSAIMRAYIDIL